MLHKIWRWALMLAGVYLTIGVINLLYILITKGTPTGLTPVFTAVVAWPSNLGAWAA